ncbi:hypothetical protein GCM10012275_20700 [Longimycelium tulufanense]|uniref:HipA-like kinase domain-containing protein n=1 Tax=Longimycelium tulufanense TaxID=907463 RepID=A0A8J3CAA3_9PSEU|nr:HipA family kinase [Longimycelium tulufanense]GGM49666.1 hypothetical protein GCM10012275_20700 [Longimycelium tulufanense]
MLNQVTALRYVTPLREGGSLPGVVETDDLGTYVVKFRGAGQGRKALVAEVVGTELARRVGLRVPELVLVELDPALAPAEPDQEVQDLLRASAGTNLGVDFLPGALDFNPVSFSAEPAWAARVLWLDALIGNVDRSWRNPNMLVWHGELWLIDHGASLIFHHNWPTAEKAVRRPYDASDHVLAPFVNDLAEVDRELRDKVTADLLTEVVGLVPADWLADEPGFVGPDAVRRAYVDHLAERATASAVWLPEAAA